MKKKKFAILISHPIQYQTPLFKKIAQEPLIDLIVYFCWDNSAKEENLDSEFGQKIQWDIPLLDGYQYKFLKNYSLRPLSDFWGQINPGIIKELRKNHYDAVLIYGWNSFTNWLVFLTTLLTKTPIFLQGESPLNQELLKTGFKQKIKKFILKRIFFPRISAFLYIGEENKKFYKYYGVNDERLFFAPYAVDNDRYIKEATIAKRQAARRALGLKGGNVAILFVGKLIEKKRPMDLLLAFSKISNAKTHLIFVGDGILRYNLENYAKDNNLKNIHFVGFKNQTELPEYYAAVDIFVLSSGTGETWGLVVNEAMCFGLPVIVSDMVGCGADLVKNGENGYIFSLGDIEKLAEYLSNLIDDGEKRKTFGKKSFKIIQNYSYTKDINGILEVLEKNK